MKKEFKVGQKAIIEVNILEVDEKQVRVEYNNGARLWVTNGVVKHAEPEFIPREMLVWDNKEECAVKRYAIGVFNNRFICKDFDTSEYDWYVYKNAKDLPKTLENGKVYKSIYGAIVFKIDETKSFGFKNKGGFEKDFWNFSEAGGWQEYPLEDFKKLLIAEAEKRGFKSGVWVDRKGIDFDYKNNRIINVGEGCLFNITGETVINMSLNSKDIFCNGIWATIID